MTENKAKDVEMSDDTSKKGEKKEEVKEVHDPFYGNLLPDFNDCLF
jgi:hypothetical protein